MYAIRSYYDFWLAEALAEQGRTAEAIRAYRGGLDKDPHDLDALMSLGDLYFESGEGDKALAIYQQVRNNFV